MAGVVRKFGSKMASALLHPSYHSAGVCNLCARHTVFICDAASDRWIRRCIRCRSTPKYRAIVFAIEQATGQPLWEYVRDHKVYELSTTSPIFRKLRGHPNYEASGYFYDKPFGEKVAARYWNQDLQALSFVAESFDLVVSSETMEHVRRPWSAFGEVRRVLKPGGIYCFTVPFRENRVTRARIDTAGPADVVLMEKIYHQDPYCPEGSLVYTDFGRDLPELLRGVGFETQIVSVLNMELDIHDDLRPMNVFVAHKSPSPLSGGAA